MLLLLLLDAEEVDEEVDEDEEEDEVEVGAEAAEVEGEIARFTRSSRVSRSPGKREEPPASTTLPTTFFFPSLLRSVN